MSSNRHITFCLSYYDFENTKLLGGNDRVNDILTSEDMENILLCIFSILLSTIYIIHPDITKE